MLTVEKSKHKFLFTAFLFKKTSVAVIGLSRQIVSNNIKDLHNADDEFVLQNTGWQNASSDSSDWECLNSVTWIVLSDDPDREQITCVTDFAINHYRFLAIYFE